MQGLGLGLLLQVEGQKIIVHKTPGWVFGDIALLFNSPRSASIEAATSIQLWAMERRVFLKVRCHERPWLAPAQAVRISCTGTEPPLTALCRSVQACLCRLAL